LLTGIAFDRQTDWTHLATVTGLAFFAALTVSTIFAVEAGCSK
jgi:hypothetical protein